MRLPVLFIRPFILMISCAVLLSGCSIYHKSTIGIDEAAASGKKVLVTRNDERKLRFKKIELSGDTFYATYKVKENFVTVPLDATDIKSIRPYNSTASLWGNIGLITGVILIIASIIIINDFNNWE